MAPLITLVVVTLALLALGALGVRPLRRLPTALRGGLAAMFLLTGVAHFAGMREELVAMVPDFVPEPELVVTLTGVAELAGAIGLLIPRTALLASAGLTLLLVAMFPANVALALSGSDIPWYDELPWRTLMQVVFLAATTTVVVDRLRAWRSARRVRGSASTPVETHATSGV